MKAHVAAATVGSTYTLVGGNERHTVAPSCALNDGRGYWVCTTCGIAFRTQLEKDIHIGGRPRRNGKLVKGPHVLAWLCPEHGAEAP